MSRLRKWRLILMCWENYRSMRADKIAVQITKGVPAAVRGLLWLKLADVFPLPTELVEEYHDLHDQDVSVLSLSLSLSLSLCLSLSAPSHLLSSLLLRLLLRRRLLIL
eukprot:TRINITY_DN1369_c0_g1_i1.p1 TRINITY_DN1369_c0_g1~~TRINITY_DN1369_c0_g1_i1.p1  ORF type:complete len:127 (+),score=14.48 TRINITY_DN1369_c0_g1_i1:59-382(+)